MSNGLIKKISFAVTHSMANRWKPVLPKFNLMMKGERSRSHWPTKGVAVQQLLKMEPTLNKLGHISVLEFNSNNNHW